MAAYVGSGNGRASRRPTSPRSSMRSSSTSRSTSPRSRPRLAPLTLVRKTSIDLLPDERPIDRPQIRMTNRVDTVMIFDNVIVQDQGSRTKLSFTLHEVSTVDLATINKMFAQFRVATRVSISTFEDYECGEPGTGTGTFCLINMSFDQISDDTITATIYFTPVEMARLLGAIKYVFQRESINVIFRRHIQVSDLKVNGLEFKFTVSAATHRDMALINRILLSDIPSMAISKVEIIENSTGFYDEDILRRLSSIVLDSEPVALNHDDIAVQYELNVANDEVYVVNDGLQYAEDFKAVRYVTSDDLIPVGENYGVLPLKFNVPDGRGGTIVEPQSPDIKLFYDRALMLRCMATRGTQKKNAKWGVVRRPGFREVNGTFVFTGYLRGNLTLATIIDELRLIVNRSDDLRIEL